MATTHMIACGRIWQNEIIIVTEEDAWREQIEHEMSIQDGHEDAAYTAGWDADPYRADTDDYAGDIEDRDFWSRGC